MKIAVIGGTGDMGFGLALRLAKAGHEVVIGSRTGEKAVQAAARAQALVPEGRFSGGDNAAAAGQGALAVIAVPAQGHRATVEDLRESLCTRPVLDITIPMAFGPLRYAPPPAGSNALETAELLGEGARVAAGFHTISATLLADPEAPIAADTLIVGNDKALREGIVALAGELGITAYDAGPLSMSPVVESLTPMLIGMNKRYGSKHIGLRLTGL